MRGHLTLTDQQSQIVGAAFFKADASIGEIAKLAGCRDHVVRSTLRALEKRGAITPHLYYNPYVFGTFEYQAFLSVITTGKTARSSLAKTLQKMESVSWLAEVGGPFNYDVLVKANSLQEVSDFFDELSAKAKTLDFEKSLAAQLSLTYFLPKYLGRMPEGMQRKSLRYGFVPELAEFDETDRRILRSMIDGPPLPLSTVARTLGMPLTSVSYRVKSLQKRGIILGFGYRLDASVFGLTPYVLLIEMQRSSAEVRKKLREVCITDPSIYYLTENLGAWDFHIGALVRDPRDVPRLEARLEDEFPSQVKKITTVPVYRALKLRNKTLGGNCLAAG